MSIKVSNLTKKFGDFTAVDKLAFQVEENHVVGFLGPNGAGKTTTLRMLVGLSEATSGTINISGVPVVFGDSVSNQKIGYLPEMPSFYLWMTGVEYLNFVADIFQIEKVKKAAKISELLKLVNLWDARNKKIGTYSGGMKQRLGIAQALINDPEVIILDEPVSALDPIGRKDTLEIIERLKVDKTILFSTHVLSDVDRICDDVIIIDHGKLVAMSPLAELKAKYASPILEIEFNKSPVKLLPDLKNQPWVKKLENNGSMLKIWLTNNDVVNENLPIEYFVSKKIGILNYGLRLPEMEDLFIELVGGER